MPHTDNLVALRTYVTPEYAERIREYVRELVDDRPYIKTPVVMKVALEGFMGMKRKDQIANCHDQINVHDERPLLAERKGTCWDKVKVI